MKYEQVYGALEKLGEIKKDLGLCDEPTEGKYFGKYTSELEMMIDKSIDILQYNLTVRANELLREGLTSTKVNPLDSITNLLNTIDESFENKNDDK